MPVFRVEKNKNYTVMSNHHLRDKRLSLKSKGLLSVILSLPEDWNYTEDGLCTITGEGKSAIRSCIHQLEEMGYITRERERDSSGRLKGTNYIVREVPQKPENAASSPNCENRNLVDEPPKSPNCGFPNLDKPKQEKPNLENQPLLNKESDKVLKKQNTEPINQSVSDGESFEETMSRLMDGSESESAGEKKQEGHSDAEKYTAIEKAVKESLGFKIFVLRRKMLDYDLEADRISLEEYEDQCLENDPEAVERLVRYITDFVADTSQGSVMINSSPVPRDIVRSKLMKCSHAAAAAAVRELATNPTIRNPKKYALSMIYNS